MEIRLLADGEEDLIIRLLSKVFASRQDGEYWKWLYKNNPAGKASVGVATESGEIVACYSICPVILRMGSDCFTAGLAVNAGTHPDYRRRGLFTRVAEAAFGDADRRGFHFILGYVEWGSAAALGQLRKLAYRRVFSMKRMVKILSWTHLLMSKSPIPLISRGGLRDLTERLQTLLATQRTGAVRQLKTFPTDVVEHERDPLSKYVYYEKSATYTGWRYFNHPGTKYFMLASHEAGQRAFIVVTLRLDRRLAVGVIVDIFGDPSEWERLLTGVERALSSSGITLVEAYLSEAHPAVGMLRSRGYLDRPHNLTAIFRPTVTTNDEEIEISRRPEYWRATVGDDLSYTG